MSADRLARIDGARRALGFLSVEETLALAGDGTFRQDEIRRQSFFRPEG